MKISKITFASITLFCLFFSLNLGSQTNGDDAEALENNGHSSQATFITCESCHGSLRNMGPTMPHENSTEYYQNYVNNNTNESAAMDCVDLEGVKNYIANHN